MDTVVPVTLQGFLAAILGGTVVLGPVVYGAFDRLKFFADVSSEWKRVLVAVVSGLVAVAAWLLAIWLGYENAPMGRTAIAEALWTYGVLTGFAAFTSSQVIHGFATKTKVDGPAWTKPS